MNEPRSRGRSTATIFAVAGLSTLALGLALAGMTRSSRPPPETRPPAPSRASSSAPSSAEAVDARARGAHDRERTRRLERRVAELEAAASPGDAAAASSPEELDLEAEARKERAWWDGVVSAHEQEHRDTMWAGGAEDLFRADLKAIAHGRGFEAIAIDCRRTSCAATLEWPSYAPDQIRQDTRALTRHRFQQNCGMSFAAPSPDDPGAPFRAAVVFHCARHRARLAWAPGS